MDVLSFLQGLKNPSIAVAGLCLLAATSSLGCAGSDFQEGAGLSCTPGELSCVCDEHQECEGKLICVADRCVDVANELPSATDPKKGSSGAQKSVESDAGASGPSGSPGSGNFTPGISTQQESGSQEDSSVVLERVACSDGVRNHRETDVDCGGPVCQGCNLGKRCRGGIDCRSNLCAEERCVQCETDEQCAEPDGCRVGRCSQHKCISKTKAEGSRCNDGNPCTASDSCRADGSCKGVSTLVLNDSFDKADSGWRFMYANREAHPQCLWEIGRARASECDDFLGEDPVQDHTQNGRNGIAGVIIGGCQTRRGDEDAWDCIWSKDVVVSEFEKPPVVSYWRHLHSPSDQGNNGVINRVVYRDGKQQVFDLARGFSGVINDSGWIFRSYELPLSVKSPVSVGICYKKLPGALDFAGWSIDDAKIRQRGCMPDQ